MWDTSRHSPPETTGQVVLPPVVASLCDVAKLPRIPTEDWPKVYTYLEGTARGMTSISLKRLAGLAAERSRMDTRSRVRRSFTR